MVFNQTSATRPQTQQNHKNPEAWEGVARLGQTIVIADDPLEALR